MDLLGALGMAGVAVLMIVFGLLSRRLGRVTHAGNHYIGFFFAALLISTGAFSRLWHMLTPPANNVDLTDSVLWVWLYHGSPALGLTVAVVMAWRYWSWLLAERD